MRSPLLVGAVVVAALACSRDDDSAWRMAPGIGGPKYPGGTVPAGLHEPIVPPIVDTPLPTNVGALAAFVRTGALPRMRTIGEVETEMHEDLVERELASLRAYVERKTRG